MQKKACVIAAILKKMIIKVAVFMAILDANQACFFWGTRVGTEIGKTAP